MENPSGYLTRPTSRTPRSLCAPDAVQVFGIQDLGRRFGLCGRFDRAGGKKTSFKMGRTHIKRCYTHDKLDISYIIIYNIDDKLDI